MDYKVVHTHPPKKIYNRARKEFGDDVINFEKGTTFTVGDTIYCSILIPKDLLQHEKVHVRQQAAMGYKRWWRKYFNDVKFRYSQEIEAYKTQYNWINNNIKDRNLKHQYLVFYARALSGELYGNLKTFQEAYNEILNKKK